MKITIGGNVVGTSKRFIEVKAAKGKTALNNSLCDIATEIAFEKESDEEFIKVFPHISLVQRGLSLLGGCLLLCESGNVNIKIVSEGIRASRICEGDLVATIEVFKKEEEQKIEEVEKVEEPVKAHSNKISTPPVKKRK